MDVTPRPNSSNSTGGEQAMDVEVQQDAAVATRVREGEACLECVMMAMMAMS
jgi:hypothetical protein